MFFRIWLMTVVVTAEKIIHPSYVELPADEIAAACRKVISLIQRNRSRQLEEAIEKELKRPIPPKLGWWARNVFDQEQELGPATSRAEAIERLRHDGRYDFLTTMYRINGDCVAQEELCEKLLSACHLSKSTVYVSIHELWCFDYMMESDKVEADATLSSTQNTSKI